MYLYKASNPSISNFQTNTPSTCNQSLSSPNPFPFSLSQNYCSFIEVKQEEHMKQKFNSCFPLLLVIFLLSSSHVSARLLSTKQGEQIELMKDAPAGDSLLKIESNDSLDNLMGLEDCENGDQECLKRRFLADAHLDYIYTQHHKP